MDGLTSGADKFIMFIFCLFKACQMIYLLKVSFFYHFTSSYTLLIKLIFEQAHTKGFSTTKLLMYFVLPITLMTSFLYFEYSQDRIPALLTTILAVIAALDVAILEMASGYIKVINFQKFK